jgi:anthranilate/para-aminobenzoate synthase component II
MSKKRILIIDFLDSFTFNIAAVLSQMGDFSIEVISYDKNNQLEAALQEIETFGDRAMVIFGPGPGKPMAYARETAAYFKLIEHNPNIFIMGVCLGHQMILENLGHKLAKSLSPLHGERSLLKIPKGVNSFPRELQGQSVWVQRYNSLAILNSSPEKMTVKRSSSFFNLQSYSLNGEIIAASGERFQSYQFHPESVGTSCPSMFFNRASKFLYNNIDL